MVKFFAGQSELMSDEAEDVLIRQSGGAEEVKEENPLASMICHFDEAGRLLKPEPDVYERMRCPYGLNVPLLFEYYVREKTFKGFPEADCVADQDSLELKWGVLAGAEPDIRRLWLTLCVNSWIHRDMTRMRGTYAWNFSGEDEQ